jgi:hypothetical protein
MHRIFLNLLYHIIYCSMDSRWNSVNFVRKVTHDQKPIPSTQYPIPSTQYPIPITQYPESYLPLNTGIRFSINAVMPSLASSVAAISAILPERKSTASSKGISAMA